MSTNQKPQAKLPTSMRYERVQAVLENQPAIRDKLGPKTCPVKTRFGDTLYFSKEAVEVTEALHDDGQDAHKAPLNTVLRVAARIMMRIGGEASAQTARPASGVSPALESVSSAGEAKKARRTRAAKLPVPATPALPSTADTSAVPPSAKKAKAAAAEEPARAAKNSKPAPVAADSEQANPASQANGELPVSELPPEKQPLSLPPNFDPRSYPHYSVQSSIYSLLLSALNMGAHYERYPGMEERQKLLEEAVKLYQNTCDALRING